MSWEVSLHDSEGKEVDPPNCSCGKVADTFIQGTNACVWRCNDCLYGKQPKAELVFKSEYGSSQKINFPTWKRSLNG